MLYIVPTPIGNLEDITLRAINVLKKVDVIACEDTRTSGRLLDHYSISTPRISYHNYNEIERSEQLVARMLDGESVALISDAGMPLVSDPGYRLVQAALGRDVPVTVLPGPSAAITALAGSGLATHRFFFEGFLPQKKGRKKRIETIACRQDTTVVYESPHRITKTLERLASHCGEGRRVVVAREISKKFEEYMRGTLKEVLDNLQSRPKIKGEIVLIIEGSQK